MTKPTDKTVATVPEIAQKLNDSVFKVLSKDGLLGFEKAYLIASATAELKGLLNEEYMKPIMQLQGSRLGFKTDRDDKGGYPMDTVRNCLIEAVLMGVQPFGNQFNIIAGNSYITKEGFGYLLKNLSGLNNEIVFELPRIKEGSAAVVALIDWTIGGVAKSKKMDIPIKVNQHMGADAVLGKATRKARAWLYNTITGNEIADGDITDVNGKVVSSVINEKVEDPLPQDIIDNWTMIANDCTTVAEIDLQLEKNADADPQVLKILYTRKDFLEVNAKKAELKGAPKVSMP